jgi:hypothetical protein|tara:strand:- start:648 stop:1076 length:429 start_codon:yes stop_codon:yes gene_type:complete
MGLNLNYSKEDGQQADYWKISRVENWFQGTTGPDYGSNVNTLGFTNETYRDAGAPSIDGNMNMCPYASGKDYYEYEDLTGVSGVVTGSQRLGPPLPDGWDWTENGVSGWMQRSDDIRSGAYTWLKVCVPFFSGATDALAAGE